MQIAVTENRNKNTGYVNGASGTVIDKYGKILYTIINIFILNIVKITYLY